MRHRGSLGLLALLALALPAAGADKPFSHKLHLSLRLDCAACHTTAAASTAVSDNNLPTAAACRNCHETVTIGEPRQMRLARFSHAQHVALGDIAPVIRAAIASKTYLGDAEAVAGHLEGASGCGACHRGLAQAETLAREHLPHMADCLVCHTHIDPPFSCETCHERGENLKPASHTPDYIDRHSSGRLNLDKQSCVICHGKTFRCLGCH